MGQELSGLLESWVTQSDPLHALGGGAIEALKRVPHLNSASHIKIYDKNCSLSIALTAMDQNLQKS